MTSVLPSRHDSQDTTRPCTCIWVSKSVACGQGYDEIHIIVYQLGFAHCNFYFLCAIPKEQQRKCRISSVRCATLILSARAATHYQIELQLIIRYLHKRRYASLLSRKGRTAARNFWYATSTLSFTISMSKSPGVCRGREFDSFSNRDAMARCTHVNLQQFLLTAKGTLPCCPVLPATEWCKLFTQTNGQFVLWAFILISVWNMRKEESSKIKGRKIKRQVTFFGFYTRVASSASEE